MSALFLRLLNLSIKAGWLVLALVAARPLLKKAPAWLKCAMWGAVGLRLALPFSLKTRISLVPSAETVPEAILTSPEPRIDSGIPVINEAVNPVIGSALAPEPAQSVNPAQTLTGILAVVWIAGMTAMLLYALVSFLRLRRGLRDAVEREPGVFESAGAETPFILGILDPGIYVPLGMRGKALDSVLAHERAHLARRDHLWKPLGFLLLSVYWFNPILWAAYVMLCRDIELACDERVIRDMDPEGRVDYSQALLDCAVRSRAIAACPLAFGETGVKQRVKVVLKEHRYAAWIVVLALVICAVILVCFLTDPAGRWLAGDGEVLNYVIGNCEVDGKKVVSGEFLESGEDEEGGYKLFLVTLEDGEKAVIRADLEYRVQGGRKGPQSKVLGVRRWAAPQGDCVKWFDREDLERIQNIPEHPITVRLEEFPDTEFRLDGSGLGMYRDDGQSVSFAVSGPAWNAYFCDLNGDGYPEVCFTVSVGSGWIDDRIQVFDIRNGMEFYELEDRARFSFSLYMNDRDPADRNLYVQKMPVMGDKVVEAGRLVLRDGKLGIWDFADIPEEEKVKLSELTKEQCLQELLDAGVVVPEGIDIGTLDLLKMVKGIEEDPWTPAAISWTTMLDFSEQVRRAVIRIEGLREEIPCGAAYMVRVGWSDDPSIGAGAVNGGSMILGPKHLYTFFLGSGQELQEFIGRYRDILNLDQGGEYGPSFCETAEEYDASYFNGNALMLVYVPSSSGSFRYRVTGVYREKEMTGNRDCVMAEIVRSNYPEVYTADMAGWIAVIELPGQALKGTYYDSVQLPGPGGEY